MNVQQYNDLIVESMVENKFVIDDHNKGRMVMMPITHMALFEDSMGMEHVVFIPHIDRINTEYPYCSINRITMGSDGLPHLTPDAVGGTLDFRSAGGLIEAIKEYNRMEAKWAGRIKLLAVLSKDGIPESTVGYLH